VTEPGPGSQQAADSAAQLLKYGMATGDQAAVDQAITELRQVLAHTAADDPDRAGRLSNLGAALQLRYPRSASPSDLAEAIACARQAIEATAPGDPDGPMYLINLFSVLRTEADRTGAAAGLDEAIAAGQAVLAQAPPRYPNRDRVQASLGAALRARSALAGHEADADAAIDVLRGAIDAAGPYGAELAGCQHELRLALQSRYERTGSVPDLDELIADLRAGQAGQLSGRDPAVESALLCESFRLRAEHTGSQADVAEAVRNGRLAAAAIAPDNSNRTGCLLALALALRLRSERVREPADLDDAIELLTEATAITGPGQRGRSEVLSQLGVTLGARFRLTGDLADLDAAVSAGRESVAEATAGGGNDAVLLGNLSSVLQIRFRQTGNISDLDEAIDAERSALGATAPGRFDHAAHLSGLSSKLRVRFWRTGNVADLDEAIDSAQTALAATDPEDSGRAGYLTNLAGALHARYWRTGQLADLDQAISGLRDALAATPAGWTEYPSRRGDLGQVLRLRANRAGSKADLDEAISDLSVAVSELPVGDRRRALYLAELGAAFLSRFLQSAIAADLDQATDRLSEATSATPLGQPDRGVRLGNLSNAQQLRYDQTRNPADLDGAIQTARDALASTPAEHPSRAVALTGLSARLLTRFELTAIPADLEESIGLARAAVAACPPGHPLAADCLRTLSDSLWARFNAFGDHAARDEAFASWRQAQQERAAPASSRIMAAVSWGEAAADDGNPELAAEGFGAAVRLLPLLAWRGLDRGSQELLLAGRPGIASDAAACAVAAGHPERAVELLEHGRAVLWSQLLQLRGELDDLRQSEPAIADRLAAIRAALDQPDDQRDLSSSAADADPAAAQPDQAALADARMRYAAEWDQLVEQVRQRPGFENFLDVPPYAELARATAGGTVVIINVSRYRCDALAATPTGLTVIPLPGLTSDQVRDRANAFLAAVWALAAPGQLAGSQAVAADGVIRDVLGWLSDAVTDPILAALRLARPAGVTSGDALPRIWWCPTGAMTVLPLHAAGQHHAGSTGDCVLNHVVSSYTPTLRALYAARTRPVPAGSDSSRMLLVTMPVTRYLAGGAPLPGAADEAEVVARHFLPNTTHLTGNLATRTHVLTAMQRASYAHFACHGGIQPADPSAGGLYLDDGPLTIRQLSECDLPAAELAFLSACQSATGSLRHLDEAITMAAATQLAGFRHVIGTLWYIADTVAPDVARGVYAALTGAGGGQPAVIDSARALHDATSQLRAAGHPPIQWAPYVHTGP